MIPNFPSIMGPMLEFLADGGVLNTVELRDRLAKRFGVTEAERAQLLPSGTGRLYDNRVAWAYVHLFQARAIERVRRGEYRITARGQKLLADYPDGIDVQVLSQFPELVAFRKGSGGKRRKADVREATESLEDAEKSPVERMAEARADHGAELALGLRNRIYECDPSFFE